MQHLKTAVGAKKRKAADRAFKQLTLLLDEKERKGTIGSEVFSQCVAVLEAALLKRYCLFGYFEGSDTPIIENFTVSFDQQKEVLNLKENKEEKLIQAI